VGSLTTKRHKKEVSHKKAQKAQNRNLKKSSGSESLSSSMNMFCAFCAFLWLTSFVPLCGLFRGELAAGVQVVPVHDRVEDEEIASFGLAAPEGIGREEQHVAVA
jgi:hypothetical protein